MKPIEDEYLFDLATAIVEKAAEDYRYYRKAEKKAEGLHKKFLQSEIKKLEKFFKSDWCGLLAMGLNIVILEKLQKEG